jgi:hypothetical protein
MDGLMGENWVQSKVWREEMIERSGIGWNRGTMSLIKEDE